MRLPPFSRRCNRTSLPASETRLDTLCEFAPVQGPQAERVLWFVDLMGWLRPTHGRPFDTKLRYVAALLERHPEWRGNVAAALSALVATCDIAQFLAYAGIPRDFHFLGAISQSARAALLPSACDTHDGTQIAGLSFKEEDHQWFAPCVSSLLASLVDVSLHERLTQSLSRALHELAHQATAQAHAPGVRDLVHLERSPFRGLYGAVVRLDQDPSDAALARAVRGRVAQCLEVLAAYRAGLAERGADLNTTFQLVRLRRQLRRLALLADLRHEPSPARVGETLSILISQAIRNQSGRRLLWSSADVLVQNLVDTAASVGRDYLDGVQESTWAAFRAGALGGLLMAFATYVKFTIASLHLPKFYEGLAFSLNYASVFVVAFLLHYTIATKLPAHTAAALARGLQRGASYRERLTRFVISFRAMVRLQLAGLVGNVLVAGPMGAVIAVAFRAMFHRELLSPEKAAHVFEAQSLLGPSVLFAALTGVLLWISSLVGAFVDNWVRVVRLADRLATSVIALRTLHPVRARERADALIPKLGGLASNIVLGCLLGGVPMLFALLELPVEIRHVTVSVSSVAMAMVTGGAPEAAALAWAGVLAIGTTNVLVSFSLALWLALRSTRGLEGDATSAALLRVGIRRWARSLVGARVTPSSYAGTRSISSVGG